MNAPSLDWRLALIFLYFLWQRDKGGSASSTALLLTALLLGFVQIQRPHLPDGHALRQGALGEALARALLAHFVAPAALLP